MIDRVKNPSDPVSSEELEAAAQRAARDAVLEHARLGFPVCGLENGQVRWFTPAETLARHERPTTELHTNS
jgi:hypothetical protein